MRTRRDVHIQVAIESGQYMWLVDAANESGTTVNKMISAGICALKAYRETYAKVPAPFIEHLPVVYGGGGDHETIPIQMGTKLKDAEREIVLRTFSYCKMDQRETAITLGVCSKTIRKKLTIYSEDYD